MASPSSKSYGLGPLPWSNETLIAAFRNDSKTAMRLVDEHPGYDFEERANSLKSVLRIFNKASKSFFQCLELFHAEVKDGHLFQRNRQADLKEFEANVQDSIYLLASSAVTLVTMARTLSKKIDLPGCIDRISAFETNKSNTFIWSLRNDLVHVVFHKPRWQINYSEDCGTTSQFILGPDQLNTNNLKKFRSYVSKHTKGIDLGELIKSYTEDVNAFHCWLQESLNLVVGKQIEDYRRCVKCIKAIDAREEWNLLFIQVIPHLKLGPYQYLDRFLTVNELNEVKQLPFQSKIQIDRIISFLDEYDACDDDLRLIVYKAFGVTDL